MYTTAIRDALNHSSRRLSAALWWFLIFPALVVFHFSPSSTGRLAWSKPAAFYLVAVYAQFWSYGWFKVLNEARKARARGATTAPRLRGKWLGNIDILRTALVRFDSEAPGIYLDELFDQVGSNTLNMGVLGGNALMTRDPAVIKSILTEPGFPNFEKGAWLDAVIGELLGRGIFNSDGAIWKKHRSMTRPYFAKERISDFNTFNRHADNLISTISRLASAPGVSASHKNGAVEIQDLFGRFTLDAASEFLFGGSLNSLADVPNFSGDDSTISNSFLASFNKAQHIVYLRSRLGDLWPALEILKNPLDDPMKVINEFVNRIVAHALEKSHSDGETGETLLDHLILETRDPKMLRDETLNILLAARDTTQSLLTSSIYVLARDPTLLARLRKEVLGAIPADGIPTHESVRGSKYIRAFLNEVLRLFPPVPFNVRSAVNDGVVVSDGKAFFVPAGCRMSYSILNTQRRKDLWGPDAHKFDPDRWLDERLSHYKSSPFSFTPFSAGPRICIGQNFAYNEASLALVRLLSKFSRVSLALDVQPKDSIIGVDEVLLLSQITLMFKGGLWVRLEEA